MILRMEVRDCGLSGPQISQLLASLELYAATMGIDLRVAPDVPARIDREGVVSLRTALQSAQFGLTLALQVIPCGSTVSARVAEKLADVYAALEIAV
jgi:hypothetical protein